MKKIIYLHFLTPVIIQLFFVFIITTKNTVAQNYIGIKAGRTINKFQVSNTENQYTFIAKKLLTTGVITTLKINEYYYFQPEISYAGKGADYLNFENVTTFISLEYLEIPLIIGFKLPVTPLYIYGGNALSYLSSGKYTEKLNNEIIDKSIDFKNFKLFDYSAIAGGGLKFGSRYTKYFIDFRYNFGLMDIWKLQNKIKTRTMTVSGGIQFKF